MDGFRVDYLKNNITPTIEQLIQAGSHAPYMYGSYPTKTFPNHYSIVTGLYPEAHGIVDNKMYDPEVGITEEDHLFTMTHSENTKWWLGEPIWNTVQANGLKSAVYFWPGSDREIKGRRPTYWLKYNQTASSYGRIDKILHWLKLPDTERPSVINVYFDEPDGTGHHFGPDSNQQLREKLLFMDGILNYFFTSLWRNDLVNCINAIILTDHGMQEVTQDIFLSEHIDTSGMEIFPGPVGRIMLQQPGMKSEEVYEQLSCQNLPLRVYTRSDVPKRFHYSSSNRIGDLVIDGNAGVKIWRDNDSSNYKVLGDHGYDYKVQSMRALFLAVGPDFKSGFKSSLPFQNIEIYNLIADLLNLKYRAPNNGTVGILHPIMVKPPILQPPDHMRLERCFTGNEETLQFCKKCAVGLPVPSSEVEMTTLVVSEQRPNLCYVSTSNYGLLFDRNVSLLSSIYALISPSQTVPEELECSVSHQKSSVCDALIKREQVLTRRNISLYALLPFTENKFTEKFKERDLTWLTAEWRCPMYDSFYQKVWLYLLRLILRYAQLYGNVLTIAGPIFDYNHDGLFDSDELASARDHVPSHYFCIAARCSTQWTPENTCSGEISTMSFAIPHKREILNCQERYAYLLMHTARVRDIELLSGLRFFDLWGVQEALIHRLHINEDLWPLSSANTTQLQQELETDGARLL
ncbi:ectonucleotide pyrophosphatase:phosphodiesterase [Trichuris trichiura]|uniref:Ectonucleotide pyrophosphatase:phosphodiesterase n=1 Tax=Trichuris trichiura TaxID=36087 RepID=A0A077Z1S7_TRITR|nr:ectonucleotide pyrophosphatase:phosphodiesterase [Trichuris trichiura]